MTKEDLLERSFKVGVTDVISVDALNVFFSQNVCIPKGKTLQALIGDKWEDMIVISNKVAWRTKPSEPIYEYKWIVGCIYGIDAITDQYHTEEELEGIPFRKIEETKRVRQ